MQNKTVALTIRKLGIITVKSTGKKELRLNEMLKKFDLKKHAGEAMPSSRIGMEKF